MNLTEIRKALATAITSGSGLRAFHSQRQNPVAPCALVTGPDSITFETMGPTGAAEITLTVTVLTPQTADRAAVERLDRYVSSGTESVRDAIEADRTLNGNCQSLRVDRIGSFGPYTVGDTDHLGVDFTVRVIAEA